MGCGPVSDYNAAMRELGNAVYDMNIPVKVTVGFIEAEIGTIKAGREAVWDLADLLEAAAEQMRGVER